MKITYAHEKLREKVRDLAKENENLKKELEQVKRAFRDYMEYRESVL